jgi:hypothetical protein
MSKPTQTDTLATTRRGHGIIRRKPGDKPLAEWWARHTAEEMALEERRLVQHPDRHS